MAARSIKVFKILMISVFCLSDVCILSVKGAGSLITTPTTIEGVLTSCGETRLTCSHDNVLGENTRWRVTGMDSSTVCQETIDHTTPTPVTPYSCNEFRFEDITALMMGTNNSNISDLNSTAVVNPLPLAFSGSRMECIAGSLSASLSAGSVTLCVIDQLPPPTNLTCENITNGLNVSWEAVGVTSCTTSDIVYSVTATGIDMMPVTLRESILETTTELTILDGLDADTTYNISISSWTAVGSCGGEEATIVCTTNASLPIITTQPSTVPTTDSSLSLTSSGPSSAVLSTGAIVGIAVAIVVVIIIVLVVVIIIVIIFIKLDGERGNNQGLHAPLADDNEKQQLPVYAMVDKSKKVPNEQPMYQDPNTIQHETTASGDVYAVSDKRGKSVANEGGAVYTEVDKSKKNHGLTYASIDMPAGGGSSELSKRPAPTEYSTVIN